MAIRRVPADYATIQAAINVAVAGDVIQIAAGVLFNENLILPNKGLISDYITITSDASPANLPLAGNRTDPIYAPFMPKLQNTGGGSPAIQTAVGANHYKLQHLEILAVKGSPGLGWNSILYIGINDFTQTKREDEPADIIIDQCYIHGDVVAGQRNAVNANGIRITVSNNYIDDIFTPIFGQDSSAVGGTNGHGPLTVTNNYISGGTEAFLLGGADPKVRCYLNFSGSPSTTTGTIAIAEAGHTLAELVVGEPMSVSVGGHHQLTTLRSVTQTTTTTGSMTYDALTGNPDVPGLARQGVILNGLIFRNNYVRNNPNWRLGVLLPQTGLAASATTGSLGAGTHYYKVQPRNTHAYLGASVFGAPQEVSQVLGASGGVSLTWSAVSHADDYRVWHGTAAGNEDRYVRATGLSQVDDGSLTYVTAKNIASSTAGFPTTITTTVAHGYSDGDFVVIAGHSVGQVNGNFLITFVDATRFSIAAAGGGTGGTVTPTPITTFARQKNLFEVKALVNGQIDSNIFEDVWVDFGDNPLGFAFWLKTANQEGEGTWLQSKNILIEKNIVRNCSGLVLTSGREVPSGSGYDLPGSLTNVTMRNILMYNSGTAPWNNGSTGTFCMAFNNETVGFTVDHCTLDHTTDDVTSGGLVSFDSSGGRFVGPLTITNNMLRRETYGIHDASMADGTASLNSATAGSTYTVTKNGIAEINTANYPAGNFGDTLTAWKAEFVNYAGGDYHIAGGSSFHNAGLDGKDLGCDVDLVLNATASVVTGIPGGIPHRRHGRFHR